MPFGGLLTLGVTAGTSLLGGLFGSSAAKTAANQQAAAAQQGMKIGNANTTNAIGAQNTALNTANANLTNQLGAQYGMPGVIGGNTTGQLNAQYGAGNQATTNLGSALGAQYGLASYGQGLYSPYLYAGQQGVGTLSQALSPSGSLSQGWTGQFQAPTAEQAAQTPGYQFALQQGQNAIQSSAAAKGNLLSGGTQKALDQYSQGLASTNYQQTYNNAFQNYQQNYGQFQQNQANQYQRLMGLTGIGTGATSGATGLAQGGANAIGSLYSGDTSNRLSLANTVGNIYGQNTGALQNYANNISNLWGQNTGAAQQYANSVGSIYNANTGAMSNLLGAQGAAQAGGTMGAANAWSGALGGIGGAVANYGYGYQPRTNSPDWTVPTGPMSNMINAPNIGTGQYSSLAPMSSIYGGFNPTASQPYAPGIFGTSP